MTINNPISLICEALAFPAPNITWMKDGVPFEASRNIQMLPGDVLLGMGDTGDTHHVGSTRAHSSCDTGPRVGTRGLQILNAQKEDAGQYTCVVTNELGEATKSYHVEVLSELGTWAQALWDTLGVFQVPLMPLGSCRRSGIHHRSPEAAKSCSGVRTRPSGSRLLQAWLSSAARGSSAGGLDPRKGLQSSPQEPPASGLPCLQPSQTNTCLISYVDTPSLHSGEPDPHFWGCLQDPGTPQTLCDFFQSPLPSPKTTLRGTWG